MKSKFKFDTVKAVASIKLVLSNMDTKGCDFHKLFKILYFAERAHLSEYGRPITGDNYVAMKDGPVPSNVYDVLRALRGDSIFITSVNFAQDFEIRDRYYIFLLDDNLDMDIFSESEVECLIESIEENKNLSFTILRDRSHDSAWNSANRNDDMSMFDIAKAGGANDELVKYISVTAENRKIDLNKTHSFV